MSAFRAGAASAGAGWQATTLYDLMDYVGDSFHHARRFCNDQLAATNRCAGVLLHMLQAYYVNVGRSRSGELIFIGSSSAITNETYWLPAYDPKAALTRIAPRQEDIEYYLHHHPGNTLDVAARAAKALEGLQQQQQQQPQGWVVVHWRDPARPNSELRVAPLHDPSQQLVRHLIAADQADGNSSTGNDSEQDATAVTVMSWCSGLSCQI
jgi:hypothetical protein